MSANPYAADRQAVLDECDAIMREVALIGYHCTRLHDGEIQHIPSEGMRPCSPALTEARISRAIAAGVLDPGIADQLRAAAVAHQPDRSEKTFFIFTAGVLPHESDVWHLLRFWGGEAIYWAHTEDAQVGAALMNIGQPCIIEAAVPADEIETDCSVGERVMVQSREGPTSRRDQNFSEYLQPASRRSDCGRQMAAQSFSRRARAREPGRHSLSHRRLTLGR